MLSSVLRSKTAIQANIQIMRAFTRLRQLILDSADLRREIEDLCQEADGKFRIVFLTLEQLLIEESKPKKKIGFTAQELLNHLQVSGFMLEDPNPLCLSEIAFLFSFISRARSSR